MIRKHVRKKEIPRFCRFDGITMNDLKLPHRTNKFSLRELPRNFQSKNRI